MEGAELRPSGTVTFLFTDIEGSMRPWDEHRTVMEVALARHDLLVRGAISDEGGVVFSTVVTVSRLRSDGPATPWERP